jgi:hypothetical protein
MALGDLLSGILGGSAGKEDMKQGIGMSKEALEQLQNVYVPTIEEQKIILQNPELAALLEAGVIDGSALAGISTDPRLKQAQHSALEELAGLSQTGLGAQDIAALKQIQRSTAGQAQAQNAATLQNAAATGTLDSGTNVMAQLMAGQQAANRAQTQGEAQAAQAAEARRQALAQYGQMSGNMANQDFNQKAQIANAKDNINQFNAQNKQAAGQFNITNQQNLNNQKASNANQQEIYNKQLIQQKFQNDVQKAGGVASQMNNVGQMYSQQGQNAANGQAQMTGAIIGGAASIGAAGVKGK